MVRKMTPRFESLLITALAGGLIVKQITGSNAAAFAMMDKFLEKSIEYEKKKGAKR